MTTINMQNIYKKYENAEDYSVVDFNLNIEEDEFIVFVGPSGCGKTTTLRMIAGLESITEGGLYIDDQLMNDVPPKDRDIAMVFQNYALYPHMTVYDNMAFGLELRKVEKKEIDERVRYAADLLGLSALLDRKPTALSGGQSQRVALGRAVVRSPKVFLMDEPLSNLDAKLRGKMRTEISKLHNSLDATTIYVTHDQTEAMTMADRIVVMRDGVVQQVGTPSEVYNTPHNAFVGSFMGSPPMNLINVRYSNGQISNDKGLDLTVNEPDRRVLDQAGYDGKEIIFGIRPEDLHTERVALEAYSSNVRNPLITVSELTGSESILYLDFAGTEVIAVVDARDYYEADTTLEVAFNMSKAHFFDRDSEEVINKIEA